MEAIEFKTTLSATGIITNEEITSFVHINSDDVNFVKVNNKEYLIQDCIFTEPLEFFNLNFKNDCIFKFVNCHFKDKANLSFVNVSCSQILFHDCTFKGELYFTKLECTNVFIFKSEIEYLRFLFNEVHFLKIENEEKGLINSIWFNSENTDYLKIKSNSIIKNINLVEGQNIEIHSPIEDIIIYGDNYKDLVIGGEIFGNTNEIRSLKVSRVEVNGFITVQNANIKFLELDSIKTQHGTLILNELGIDKFIMEDCQIKNVQFNIVEFKRECEIIRSNLDGIKLFNVKWLKDRTLTPNFKKLKIPFFQRFIARKMTFEGEPFNIDDQKEMRYQQDSYRQLKAASFANHNTIDGLGFYKNEMRLYWKEIRINGGENFWDTLLIFINRWVSNFGQSYLRPLFLLFFVHYLLFISLIGFPWCNELDASQEAHMYFYLLNPAHKIPDYINTVPGYITEFLMRGLTGFFAFHFIKATRKFGKV